MAKSAKGNPDDIIITSDWHLTDGQSDQYRWEVFSALRNELDADPCARLFILGDIADRKDRHSSILVNRLVAELVALLDRPLAPAITMLIGNHDTPLDGPPFWLFLNSIGVEVVAAPTLLGDALFLPHASDPAEEWKKALRLKYGAIFMHQTVTGAVGENGTALRNDKMPKLPNVPIYSGDLHVPQTVGPVTYIGAPHPIKFGDSYPCRMLRLTDKFVIRREIPLAPIRKLMLDVTSLAELREVACRSGDQARVRISLDAQEAANWPDVQNEVNMWAYENRVSLASVEIAVKAATTKATSEPAAPGEVTPFLRPQELLRLFIQEEDIRGHMQTIGKNLLKEAMG